MCGVQLGFVGMYRTHREESNKEEEEEEKTGGWGVSLWGWRDAWLILLYIFLKDSRERCQNIYFDLGLI